MPLSHPYHPLFWPASSRHARIDSAWAWFQTPLQFLAKLATNLAKPKGVRVLLRRDVSSLLASTPAIKIPGCGAGSVASKQFAAWGANSVLDLRQVNAAELRERLGEQLGVKVKISKPAPIISPISPPNHVNM